MLRVFEKALRDFFDDRITEISNELIMKNSLYKDSTSKIIKIQSEIGKNLPSEANNLLDGYELNYIMLEAISQKITYEQGIKDGLKLGYIVADQKLTTPY